MVEFEELPESCIATILSHTTPIDTCRLSVVSKTFHSASNSDDVWNRFLPSDSNLIDAIFSWYPYLANLPSKKAMFLALPNPPIIIDNGKKSFQLDKKSGKMFYMLSARSLTIACSARVKKWNTKLNSRFPKVAELCNVSWFEIRGTINSLSLSPNTHYAAYLVFKMNGAHGFENEPAELSVGVEDGRCITKFVCLDPYFLYETNHRPHRASRPTPKVVGLQRPSVRSDGWFEIEMGKFFNSSLEDKVVRMSVIQKKGHGKMENFFLEGIEVRPKEAYMSHSMLREKEKIWDFFLI
ncbi:putative F-box protein PP2-B12 [Trifolium pratense]|uniref:putative F-box protein PP2-B12 n=1 Tax=Trifolium pratense TaxID=57577 RepID=UPI001E694E9E|nr:putative F-box protein PP2-B12 [Trifolium pratense]